MKPLFVACAFLALSCSDEEIGQAPPADAFFSPTGIAAHPDGQYLYVANAGFDRRYRSGSLQVIDAFAGDIGQVVPESTVEIGLYAGELALMKAKSCASEPCAVQGLVPTRDDSRLVHFTVDQAKIDCHQDGKTCGNDALISAFNDDLEMSKGPYSLAIDADWLAVSHVDEGEVSFWRLNAEGPEFACSGLLSGGATSVAWHPVAHRLYVTDRYGTLVQVVSPQLFDHRRLEVNQTTSCEVVGHPSIAVGAFQDSGFSRGIALSADGSLLYVIDSSDGALWIYDSSLDENGEPRHLPVSKGIPVGRGANLVRVAGLRPGESRLEEAWDRGAAGQIIDEKGGGLVYVSALDDGQIVVIDPTLRAAIAHIKVCPSPHDIAFLPNAEGQLRGYVTCFESDRIAVIDLEPGSETRFTHLGDIQ